MIWRTVRGELDKIRTTGMALGITGVAVGLSLLSILLGSGGNPKEYFADLGVQRGVVGAAAWAGTSAMLLGAIGMTSEDRHKTITPSLLAIPNRTAFVIGKAVAYALAGMVIALITMVVCFPAALLRLRMMDVEVLLGASDWMAIGAGCLVYAALAGAVGVGLGALINNQIALLTGLLIWFLLLEALVIARLPEFGKLTPGGLGAGLAGPGAVGISAYNADSLARPIAGLVYLVYVAIAVGLGVMTIRRKDVA